MEKRRKSSILIALALAAAMLAGAACSAPASDADDKTVQSLVIAQQPDRTRYIEGESFDPDGTVIDANLKDGSVQENVPYQVECSDPLTAKDYRVVFSYGGKSVALNLEIDRLGNSDEYAVANTPALESSPLEGKTYFFLGSSVTLGARSGGESMADYIAKRNGAVCIKEAVEGTTLMDNGGDSYVQRLDRYIANPDRAQHLDAFICQLSTNDIKYPDNFGTVTPAEQTDPASFDTSTSFGALEYIIATVRQTWGCPIVVYTNPDFGNENYETMLTLLDQVQAKWGVSVIDLYRDADFNAITPEQESLYMYDTTHPTKAGYRDWWTPRFEEMLLSLAET